MNKAVATQLMLEILKLGDQLNLIIRKVEENFTDEELQVMRRHMGMMMIACDQHLFKPVVQQYPELDPHR